MGSQVARELPRYRCHKEVWSLKIKSVEPIQSPPCMHCGYAANEVMHIGCSSGYVPPNGRHAYAPEKAWKYAITDTVVITPEDERYAPFAVDGDFVQRHNPVPGSYFVVYKDGYRSISPAEAFEEGYSLIP